METIGESETRQQLPQLVPQLNDHRRVRRVDAVSLLGEHWPESLPHLCRALRGNDEELRLAAVKVLGSVGDARAIEPLLDALRGNCLARSARRQRLVGLLLLVATIGIILGGVVWGIAALKFGGFVSIPFHLANGLGRYYENRKKRSVFNGVVVAALEEIASRHPTPELRRVLPELRALSADALQQEASFRVTTREAAARIEALTAEQQGLPLPASIPSGDVGADVQFLPLPSRSEEPNEATLPRISSG